MINLVTINHKENGEYPKKCHISKCANQGRYQLFQVLGADELPDWEGLPICSKHLAEEARHRPEIAMSLIDIMIDALENHKLINAPARPPKGSGKDSVIPFRP